MKKLLVVTLSLFVLLVGCNTEGGGDSASQGVTEDKIIVGNSAATSGAYASVGVPFIAGMEAYFAMVNENGGIDGREIEFKHYDDEFVPEKGKTFLEQLVYDDEVFALVGHFGTPIVGATLDDIKEIGIPTVYFATGTGILYEEAAEGNERAVMPVQPVYPMEGRIISSWAKGKFDGEKIGVIYTNDDAGKDLLTGIEQEAEELGIEIVSEQVAAGDADVSAAITKINSESPDVIVAAAIQGTFPQIIKELAKQGNEAPVLTSYVNIDPSNAFDLAEEVDSQFDVYANYWVDLTPSEDLDNYTEWVAKQSDEDFSANPYAMTGWIAAAFFVEGLERLEGEDVTWEAYIDAMEEEPVKNPFGGFIDFSDGQRLGTQEMGLNVLDPEGAIGWSIETELMSMEEILDGE